MGDQLTADAPADTVRPGAELSGDAAAAHGAAPAALAAMDTAPAAGVTVIEPWS